MSDKQDRLRQWWEALNERQRTEALRFKQTGSLSPDVAASLRGAGLLARPKAGKPPALPSDVSTFLKARH